MCGILSIVMALFVPLVGIVAGIILGIAAIVLASRDVKAGAKNGKITGGRVCGIVGLVIAILILLAGVVLGITAVNLYEQDSSSSSSSLSSVSSFESTSADEQACEDILVPRLESLKNKDSAVVKELADELDDGFEDAFDISHSDIGASPTDLAKWLLTDLNYEIDGIYVDSDGKKATAYVDFDVRDAYAFMTYFYDEAEAYFNTSEGKALSGAKAAAKLGDFYNDAMKKTNTMTSYYASFKFVKKGDTWQLDEDTWDDEIENMFAIYTV